MRIDFTKMHGLGNDFIVFDAPAGGSAAHRGALAAAVGPPHRHRLRPGAGARSRRGGRTRPCSTASSTPTGIEVEQCGNGARCIAALLHRRGRASDRRHHHGQPGRAHPCARARTRDWCRSTWAYRISTRAALPFDASSEAHVYPLEVAGSEVDIGAVSMGNPHAVLTVPSVDAAPVDRLGPAIETIGAFRSA